jgi:1-acyl-sn-glycerol-3-phosphate acyltransferase
MDRMKTTVWTLLKHLLLIVYGLCIRVRVQGNARVVAPLRHGFIVAANHLNGADSFVLQVALRTRLFFVVSRKWFAGRFSRFIMWHICDAIPAETGDAMGSVAGLRHCISTLRSGGSVAIYPEGVFNRTGAPTNFQDGTAYLAVRTGTPILPVYIRNLKLATEVISTNRSIECWTGFLSVIENLFNVGIELVIGDPIEPVDVPTGQPDRLRAEVTRINGEMGREFAQLASYSGSTLEGCQP